MDARNILVDASFFGGVAVTPDNKKIVSELVNEGKLTKPSVMALTSAWAFVPKMAEECAWVIEQRIRPDHAEALPDYYSEAEQDWQPCDHLGNPSRHAYLSLQDALMDINPRHYAEDYEVRVRRVGTPYLVVVVAGKAPEAVQ